MPFELHSKDKETGFTADEIKQGVHLLYMDLICQKCNYRQAYSLGCNCLRCGRRIEV